MLIAGGDLTAFFRRPISLLLLVATALIIAWVAFSAINRAFGARGIGRGGAERGEAESQG
jgi:hypothetical protein